MEVLGSKQFSGAVTCLAFGVILILYVFITDIL